VVSATYRTLEAAMDLHPSPLLDRHVALGAKLAPFAGWEMPLEYAGVLAEHQAVRTGVGVFDVSHLGTVLVNGADAESVIARTFTNDPAVLEDGRSQYTLCANVEGGIIDDCIVYRLQAEQWVVIPNGANTAAVLAQLQANGEGREVTVDDQSKAWAILAVQGPQALAVAELVTGVDGSKMPFQAIEPFSASGVDGLVCRTGYTGEVGVEIVVPNAAAGGLWDALAQRGATPCGLGARDTLRLEMGYPLHGNDIGPGTSPYDARLGWAVKLDRADFTGRDALAAAKAAGPKRRLLGLLGATRRPLRSHMTVHLGDAQVGEITSGGFAPSRGVGIGLAYLDDPIKAGDTVEVDVRGTRVPVEVVRPPFMDQTPHG
jgi:aminomethyltransferase